MHMWGCEYKMYDSVYSVYLTDPEVTKTSKNSCRDSLAFTHSLSLTSNTDQ